MNAIVKYNPVARFAIYFFEAIQGIVLALVSLAAICIVSAAMLVGVITNSESIMKYLDLNNIMTQDQFIELVTITPVVNELKVLRKEHEELSKRVVELKEQNEQLLAQNVEVTKKLNNAMVPEASVGELVHNRVVVPVNEGVIKPLNTAVVQPTKSYIKSKLVALSEEFSQWSY